MVQVPPRPIEVPHCLDHVLRLEILSLTTEDLRKTEMYAQERIRRELRERLDQTGGGLDGYLASLDMVMTIGLDDVAPLKRLSQLLQKTNQFNPTTRRHDEQRIRQMIEAPESLVAHFSLKDIFGDSGLVGIAILDLSRPGCAELDSFLMSCRVIARKAESAFRIRSCAAWPSVELRR